MIQIHNVSIAFGGNSILRRLTWTIRAGQRIGLIGPNGAGKTTILRLITGSLVPDEGTISASGDATIGYLEQDVQEMDEERSVVDEAMTAFSEALSLQEREDEIIRQLSNEDDHESPHYVRLLEAQANIHTDLVRHEIHLIRPKTEAVLTGLGFDPDDLDRAVKTFSGGWRMRVALARLLLRRPQFLLLDEPTNHLDIDSIDWLEGYLKSYPGTVIIVSHDRYFLDRMVTVIAELSYGKVTEYHGNYAYYLGERDKRRELQQSAYENQQKQIADTKRFIERFRYKASKATQVQSRVKTLEKLDLIEPPESDASSIRFRFPEPTRSGRSVLSLSKFSKTYQSPEGPVDVFQDAGPLVIERGEKIAIIGKNGAGKSTLARMLYGTESFDGERVPGYKVETTFFAQHQADSLAPEHTVLESLQAVATGQSETEIRSLLGAFLFSGDDVFKTVNVLSGGEKSRVALARTLLTPANFLILDEPTNHLDIQSINVLIEALRQYSGTFVIVSHDRHFVDQVVNRIWRLGDGTVRSFIGDYSEYVWQTQHGTARDFVNGDAGGGTREAVEAVPARSGGPKTREQKRAEAEARKDRSRKAQLSDEADLTELSQPQLTRLYQTIETSILAAEKRQRALEADLSKPDIYSDPDSARATTSEYESVQGELSRLYERWEQLATLLTD
ncbi:MAG: ABC-F family ATP-binding cassette domain-containing protein [Rhodothermales bacterium]|nr:ABC-F family ATP-binding cassette domain-containing protein [Rhodothermales bacterium]